jgi:hypothetical protein
MQVSCLQPHAKKTNWFASTRLEFCLIQWPYPVSAWPSRLSCTVFVSSHDKLLIPSMVLTTSIKKLAIFASNMIMTIVFALRSTQPAISPVLRKGCGLRFSDLLTCVLRETCVVVCSPADSCLRGRHGWPAPFADLCPERRMICWPANSCPE